MRICRDVNNLYTYDSNFFDLLFFELKKKQEHVSWGTLRSFRYLPLVLLTSTQYNTKPRTEKASSVPCNQIKCPVVSVGDTQEKAGGESEPGGRHDQSRQGSSRTEKKKQKKSWPARLDVTPPYSWLQASQAISHRSGQALVAPAAACCLRSLPRIIGSLS